MAGGLFAITKRWFAEIGQYDYELQQYGGEEMEISFKVWQCGGKLRSVPCSRIGHVFRTNKYWQGQVYPVDGDIITRNKLRAAHVWMDQARSIVEIAFAPLPARLSLGDLTDAKKVRDRLKCHGYEWYHANVYPELYYPPMADAHWGALRTTIGRNSPACIDTLSETQVGSSIGVYPCHYQHGSQAYLLSEGSIRVAETDFLLCISISGILSKQQVVLSDCNASPWIFEKSENKVGKLKQGNNCLRATDEGKPPDKSPFSLLVVACENASLFEWV